MAIIGEDNRKDIWNTSNTIKGYCKSVAAIFLASDLDNLKNNNLGRFINVPNNPDQSLCHDEPFYGQPRGAIGTAFLVAPGIIATAGHIIDFHRDDLTLLKLVFGFQMKDLSALQPFGNLIVRGLSEIIYLPAGHDPDFALVKLDDPFNGGNPLKFRQSGIIGDAQQVYILGHPCGLPAKYADGASVKENDKNKSFFITDLDVNIGNSGSPVFNVNDNRIEGILISGELSENDFEKKGGCWVSKIIDSADAMGAFCTRTTEFSPWMQD